MPDTDGNDSINWSEDEIMDLTVEVEDDEVADHMDAHGFDLNMLPEEATGEAEIDLNTVPQDVPDPEGCLLELCKPFGTMDNTMVVSRVLRTSMLRFVAAKG
ncbi:hypothetical protein PR202_ga07902 [Eleusine coracana subsp. coracana]|uniref:Uncharacterized protein n=1 Tax=Eleusine coracana subsp. coracana TaxID=191504 RepID=A0AAV5C0S9_ELECO|nr:hypothetical protein PR202_ga07902 [Eleusine coracana subsp. coracana]